MVSLSVLEPESRVLREGHSSVIRLRCSAVGGKPARLVAVHWLLDHQPLLSTLAAHHSSSALYHRVGSGQHFALAPDSAQAVDGSLLAPGQSRPVHLSHSPDVLVIENATRALAGNYSCLGFNGAANSSQASAPEFISVECKSGWSLAPGVSISTPQIRPGPLACPYFPAPSG